MKRVMQTMDGNQAAAYASYAFTEVAGIYPITPSSPCPACQVPSPVGVHCVDCARQAQGRRRGPRTILGGRPSADAMVTKALIAACAAVGLIQLAMPLVTSRFGWLRLTIAREGKKYQLDFERGVVTDRLIEIHKSI